MKHMFSTKSHTIKVRQANHFFDFDPKMTRREGTSKSNSVVARRRFAAKTKFAQICDSHGKILIVRDLPIPFGSKQVKVEHLFDREREREREPTERERER